MCGRFAFRPNKLNTLKLRVPESELSNLKARFNIAPTQQAAAVVAQKERHIEPLRWGLIPSWAKEEAIGNKMINARCETITEKPSFKSLLIKQRCAILADGFYEWSREGKTKQPYFFHLRSGLPFAFAGLWSTWLDSERKTLKTFTIITTSPNKLLAPIHNRMPVILDAEALEIWLDPEVTDSIALLPLLKPYDADEMEAFPVSKLVNAPQNDSEMCIKPIVLAS